MEFTYTASFARYPVRENKNPRIAVLKTELESYNV